MFIKHPQYAGTVLEAGDTTMNKTGKILSVEELTCHQGRKQMNKQADAWQTG